MEKNQHIKPSVIQIRRLRKVYRLEDESVVALHSISADIRKGEICCIFGTSGSGKSTLLNQLAGMEKPTSGSVRIGRTDITKLNERDMVTFRRKHIGFIFQAYNLLPGLTALENVALPMMFQGYPKKERNRKAVELLKKVGLEKRIYHYPAQMSGGQQQRVGIARAFVTKPEVVFADEPTGNLDTNTTAQIMGMITEMARENQQTIVLVTHDPHMASYADRIITLIDGEIVRDEKNTPAQDTPDCSSVREEIQDSGKEMQKK